MAKIADFGLVRLIRRLPDTHGKVGAGWVLVRATTCSLPCPHPRECESVLATVLCSGKVSNECSNFYCEAEISSSVPAGLQLVA